MSRANAALDRSCLPRRARARLWMTRRVDLSASWLVVHVHWRAGMLLWKACGMW
jgi:hypothetical protein